jgi:MFS family permease
VAIGLNNSAFWLISPLQLKSQGFTLSQIATFIACAIAGAVLLQFPLGYFSDRVDRRLALAVAAGCGSLAAVALAVLDHPVPTVAFACAFVYGATTLPLYALVSAHANDRAQPGQYMILASGLSFFFSCGAVVGPLAGSSLFHRFGGAGIYGYLAAALGGLALLAAFRLVVRPGKRDAQHAETLTGVTDSGEVVPR